MFKFLNSLRTIITFDKEKNQSKKSVKKSKFVWRKNPPEQKFSIIFVTKIGTKNYKF